MHNTETITREEKMVIAGMNQLQFGLLTKGPRNATVFEGEKIFPLDRPIELISLECGSQVIAIIEVQSYVVHKMSSGIVTDVTFTATDVAEADYASMAKTIKNGKQLPYTIYKKLSIEEVSA